MEVENRLLKKREGILIQINKLILKIFLQTKCNKDGCSYWSFWNVLFVWAPVVLEYVIHVAVMSLYSIKLIAGAILYLTTFDISVGFVWFVSFLNPSKLTKKSIVEVWMRISQHNSLKRCCSCKWFLVPVNNYGDSLNTLIDPWFSLNVNMIVSWCTVSLVDPLSSLRQLRYSPWFSYQRWRWPWRGNLDHIVPNWLFLRAIRVRLAASVLLPLTDIWKHVFTRL